MVLLWRLRPRSIWLNGTTGSLVLDRHCVFSAIFVAWGPPKTSRIKLATMIKGVLFAFSQIFLVKIGQNLAPHFLCYALHFGLRVSNSLHCLSMLKNYILANCDYNQNWNRSIITLLIAKRPSPINFPGRDKASGASWANEWVVQANERANGPCFGHIHPVVIQLIFFFVSLAEFSVSGSQAPRLGSTQLP